MYNLRSLSLIGTVQSNRRNQTVSLAVSIWAPNWRNTLLAIKKGVLDGTTIIFSQCEPRGMNTALRPCTMESFPKRKFTAQGASFMAAITWVGRLWQSSLNWSLPITDKLAPKSTIPNEPCVANSTCASSPERSLTKGSKRLRGLTLSGYLILSSSLVLLGTCWRSTGLGKVLLIILLNIFPISFTIYPFLIKPMSIIGGLTNESITKNQWLILLHDECCGFRRRLHHGQDIPFGWIRFGCFKRCHTGEGLRIWRTGHWWRSGLETISVGAFPFPVPLLIANPARWLGYSLGQRWTTGGWVVVATFESFWLSFGTIFSSFSPKPPRLGFEDQLLSGFGVCIQTCSSLTVILNAVDDHIFELAHHKGIFVTLWSQPLKSLLLGEVLGEVDRLVHFRDRLILILVHKIGLVGFPSEVLGRPLHIVEEPGSQKFQSGNHILVYQVPFWLHNDSFPILRGQTGITNEDVGSHFLNGDSHRLQLFKVNLMTSDIRLVGFIISLLHRSKNGFLELLEFQLDLRPTPYASKRSHHQFAPFRAGYFQLFGWQSDDLLKGRSFTHQTDPRGQLRQCLHRPNLWKELELLGELVDVRLSRPEGRHEMPWKVRVPRWLGSRGTCWLRCFWHDSDLTS